MAGASMPCSVPFPDLSTQLHGSTAVSRLQSWMEVHIDARIARSLCDFRDHELSAIVASARDQVKLLSRERNDRSCERLEAVVASVAEAQARQLSVVEELSQELGRVRDAAVIPNANSLEQAVAELKQACSSRDIARSRTDAKVELHSEAIHELQDSRREDESQREAMIMSIELLKCEFEKQRSGLDIMQQWAKKLQAEVGEQQQQRLMHVPCLHEKVSRCEEQLQELYERLRQVGLADSSNGLIFAAKVASSPPQFGLPTAWSELKEAVSATHNEAENSSQAISSLKEALREHLESSHTELARSLTTVARQLVEELRAEAWEVLADHAGSISALRRSFKSIDQRSGETRPEISHKGSLHSSPLKSPMRSFHSEDRPLHASEFAVPGERYVNAVKASTDSNLAGTTRTFQSYEEAALSRKDAEKGSLHSSPLKSPMRSFHSEDRPVHASEFAVPGERYVNAVKASTDSNLAGTTHTFQSYEEAVLSRKDVENACLIKSDFEHRRQQERMEARDLGTEDDVSESLTDNAHTSPRVSLANTEDASSIMSHQQSVGFCATMASNSSGRILDTE